MAKVQETEIERDTDGRVVGYKDVERPVIVKRKGGGFGWGLLFGLLIAVIAVGYFAYSHGSFQNAGVTADRATAQVEQKAGDTAHQAANSLDTAGDQAQQQASNTRSQTPAQ